MPNIVQTAKDYYSRARHRAGRRKSAWNALPIPFGFAAWLGIWYALFRLVWMFHTAIYPEHKFGDFWQEGVSSRSFILSFLMVFSPMPGAIAAGLMLANVLFWLITPARRIFDAEARGYPGTGFRESMLGLFIVAVCALTAGLAVACAAAYFLKSLR